MMHIDHYAYASKLRHVDPVEKLIFVMVMIFTVLGINFAPVSLIVLGMMVGIILGINKTPFAYVVKLFWLPMGFLVISVLTIAFTVSSRSEGFVIFMPFAQHYIGASYDSLASAGELFLKSLSCISALYLLSLSTPFIDLLSALKRLRCPVLLIELMHLIYKMIFVLLETANTMVVAQDSRLGYSGLKSSYRSFSALSSSLLIRSFKRADALYTALEARGYDGALNVLEEEYTQSTIHYVWMMTLTIGLVLLAHWFKG